MLPRILSLALLAMNASSQISSQNTIDGRVLHAVTGEPVRRANITIVAADRRVHGEPLATVTDAAGAFRVSVAQPGDYRVLAERNGFARSEHTSRIAASETGPTQPLTIRLQPHAVITGRVIDEEGEPVALAHVQARKRRYVGGRLQFVPAGTANTNDLGEYRIFGLESGGYYVTVVPARRFPGAAVTRPPTERTQPETSYMQTWFPDAVGPESATAVPLSPGQVMANVDLRLQPTRVFHVRGRVTNLPDRTHRTAVHLMVRDGLSFDALRSLSNTAPDGSFDLSGATPGSYLVTAELQVANERFFARVPVEIGNADVSDLDVTLAPAPSVAVTLRFVGEAKPAPGELRVRLESTANPFGGGPEHPSATEGAFLLEGVAPDTYRVSVSSAKIPVYVKSVAVGSQLMPDHLVTVAPGADTAIEILVSSEGGSVIGSVRAAGDQPAAGAMVVLAPDKLRQARTDLFRTAIADSSGNFSIEGIAPGEYNVMAFEKLEGDEWLDPLFLQTHESKGTSLTISEKGRESADLKLIPVGGA